MKCLPRIHRSSLSIKFRACASSANESGDIGRRDCQFHFRGQTLRKMPVKRCSYGLCNSDSRYPIRIPGIRFIPFPKPKRSREKCMRWIRACGRPHEQLNVHNIGHGIYVCSKHFVEEHGPTDNYPDPIPVDGGTPFRARKKRKMESNATESANITVSEADTSSTQAEHTTSQPTQTMESEPGPLSASVSTQTQCDPVLTQTAATQTEETVFTQTKCDPVLTQTAATQTEETVYSEVDVLAKLQKLEEEIAEKQKMAFNPDNVKSSKIQNLFQYYTGLSYTTFLVLFTFLFPAGDNQVQYSEKRSDIKSITSHDQLFLVLCRLRNGFHLKDIAFRFSLSVQSVSVIFNSLIHFMYLKLGYLSVWPHRDVIIENMTPDYRREFPTSIAIIDCTEIKTQKPSAFDSQSQCYSEYKSNTTLKGLVAVDPRGSVMFVSLLFSGSISDNEICNDSGFYSHLSKLKEKGYILDGDAIMADKGFRIAAKLSEMNINLNIPPFASCTSQMSIGDVAETKRIAAHRIHVERAINRIKNFKLVSRRIPISLFHMINEIWFVCATLTNFLPTLVRK